MTKPQPSEYHSFFNGYIQLVPEGDLLQLFDDNATKVKSFFSSVPKEKHDHRYQPDKWSIRQILLHLTDTERVMSYRALSIARGDSESYFPSMDENLFAKNAIVDQRSIDDLLDEFATVRKASVFLFSNLSDEQMMYTGYVMKERTTTRALGFIIAGHCLHHINVIQERYLK